MTAEQTNLFGGGPALPEGFRYQPDLVSPAQEAALMEEVLASSENRRVTLLRFVEQMSPQEAAQLREALEAATGDGEGSR